MQSSPKKYRPSGSDTNPDARNAARLMSQTGLAASHALIPKEEPQQARIARLVVHILQLHFTAHNSDCSGWFFCRCLHYTESFTYEGVSLWLTLLLKMGF